MAGTTNFLPWNPSAINQETDAQYLVDTQRTGGSPVDAEFPSATANKLFYQLATFIAAFCQALANKNYSTSDADISVLTSVLSNILTNNDLRAPLQVQGFSPTPAFNLGSFLSFQMTLSGNVTSSTVSGVQPGFTVVFCFIQDATGGRTVSYPAGTIGAIQPDPTPNSVSFIAFQADSSGVLRAVTPLMSNNGIFTTNINGTSLTLSGAIIAASAAISGLFTVNELTFSTPPAAGSVMMGDGTKIVPKQLSIADVTGSRSFSSNFQNTSGYEMDVYINGQNTAGVGTGGLLTGFAGPSSGSQVSRTVNGITNSGGKCGVYLHVPAGWWYSATFVPQGGSPTLSLFSWHEGTYA